MISYRAAWALVHGAILYAMGIYTCQPQQKTKLKKQQKQPKDKSNRIGKDLFTVIRSLCDSDDFCKPFRADETVAKHLLPTSNHHIIIFIGLSSPILTISLCRKQAAYPFGCRFRAAVICPYYSVSAACINQQNPLLIAVIRYLLEFQV